MVWDINVKERVYHRLANEIFFRIYNGYYQLGAKLPTFPVIAKEAGMAVLIVRNTDDIVRTAFRAAPCVFHSYILLALSNRPTHSANKTQSQIQTASGHAPTKVAKSAMSSGTIYLRG